jgi:trimeric autotransporter adhesin
MQRFFALVVLFAFSIPVGMSIAGCGHNQNNYCTKNGHAYGVTTSQVVYVSLQPETTGISLSWGQTGQLQSPTAYNCNGDTESVSKYTYASTNLSLADISPTGAVCGGTWNRNSPGGIADYTICTPPTGATISGFSQCTSSTCGVAVLTATGAAVTSNPVNVYVHPPITSIDLNSSAVEPQGCVSQGTTQPTSLLSATTVYGPGGVALPQSDIGTITYSAVNSTVVNINNTQNPTDTNPVTGTTTLSNPNGIATANLPGSTVINATVADVTSAAGYFYTCPPAKIALSINGGTSATVTTSSPQTITSAITDTNGTSISGLTLDYESTEPQNLAVSSAGVISTTFPSKATITGICQPTTCNPAPIEKLGVYGDGTPVVANNLSVTSAGRSSNLLWMASSKSEYFSQVDLTTGANGAPIKLPYYPNSMVMDGTGSSLYFGSWRELMIYSASTNSISKQDTNVPGVVLAAAPDNSTVVINDQLRQVLYFYTVSTGAYTSTTGVGTHAEYSPDGKNVYIVGPNHLYVHNVNTGWSTYSISSQPTYSCTLNNNNTGTTGYDPFCGPGLTLTVPSVAAFLSGTTTDAYGFCPDTSVDPVVYYPKSGSANATTSQVTATADGNHILGADTSNLSDVWLTSSNGVNTLNGTPAGVPAGGCPLTNNNTVTLPLTIDTGTPISTAFTSITPTEIDQVVSSPDSSVAFVTYQSAAGSGLLPAYTPSDTENGAGTLTNVQLSGSPGSPISGIFSPDGSIFFVGTSGDGLVHEVSPTSLTDTGTTINPKLTDVNGNAVAPEFMAVKSRSTT